MNTNPAIPYAATGTLASHQFTLNDLRVHSNYAAQEKSSGYGLALSGIILVGVVAVSVFIWLDPVAMFARPEARTAAPAAPRSVPAAEPAKPSVTMETVLPLRAPVNESPAAQSVAPAATPDEAPAAAPVVVKAPHASARAGKSRSDSGSSAPQARSSATARANMTKPEATPEASAVSPMLSAKPEEKAAPAVMPNRSEETRDVPKIAAPAAADQAPANGPTN